jgi:Na+/melibiose symporter-like transporter
MRRTSPQCRTGFLTPSAPLVLLGGGQLSRSVLWCTVDLLIGYHLIVRLSISAHAAGALLATTFALSAVPDFFVGRWLARRADPVAAALRTQFTFGVLALLSAMLLFSAFPAQSEWKVSYLYVMSLLFRFTYAAFDVSQNALVSLLPSKAEQAKPFVTVKLFASSLGRLAAAVLVAWSVAKEGDLLADVETLAVVAIPFTAILYAFSRVMSTEAEPAHMPSTFEFSHLPVAALTLPVVATVCEVGLLGFAGRLIPLFPKQAGTASSSSLIVAMVCGTVVGPWLSFVAGNRRVQRLTLIGFASASATWSAVKLLQPFGVVTGFALAAMYGTGLAILTTLVWEQVSIVVLDHAESHGTRIDAPAFAVITTAIKIAIALSAALFGFFLDDFRQGGVSSVQSMTIVLVIGGSGAAITLVLGELWRKPRLRAGPQVTQVA